MPLKNGYSDPLELASLLIHIDMRNPKVGPWHKERFFPTVTVCLEFVCNNCFVLLCLFVLLLVFLLLLLFIKGKETDLKRSVERTEV